MRYRHNHSGILVPYHGPKNQRGFFTCGPGFFGGVPSPSDPYFSYVVSLMHFQGANNGTVFTDVISGSIWMPAGTPVTSSTQAKFGATSGWSGTGSGIVGQTFNAAFSFPGDLTVEGFIYCTSCSGGHALFSIQDGSNKFLPLYMISETSSESIINGAVPISGIVLPGTNAWYHAAFTRSGTTVTVWINGVSAGTGTVSGTLGSTSLHAYVINENVQQNFTGFVAESRVTNGICRYTSTFTPPTAPFPDH